MRKSSVSSSGFSKAIELFFHTLSQQKVIVIMTCLPNNYQLPTVHRILAAIWLLPEIVTISCLHKYLNDEHKLFDIPCFQGLWPNCLICSRAADRLKILITINRTIVDLSTAVSYLKIISFRPASCLVFPRQLYTSRR